LYKKVLFMKLNPWFDLFRYHARLLRGQIQITHSINATDGAVPDHYRPFLKVIHAGKARQPQVALRVTFRVPRLSLMQRYLIPILSIPFFAGAPGFSSKVFYIDESASAFCGFYIWESEKAAQSYIQSYPGAFMERISEPGSLRYDILTSAQEQSR
jgi:hypothetical protein